MATMVHLSFVNYSVRSKCRKNDIMTLGDVRSFLSSFMASWHKIDSNRVLIEPSTGFSDGIKHFSRGSFLGINAELDTAAPDDSSKKRKSKKGGASESETEQEDSPAGEPDEGKPAKRSKYSTRSQAASGPKKKRAAAVPFLWGNHTLASLQAVVKEKCPRPDCDDLKALCETVLNKLRNPSDPKHVLESKFPYHELCIVEMNRIDKFRTWAYGIIIESILIGFKKSRGAAAYSMTSPFFALDSSWSGGMGLRYNDANAVLSSGLSRMMGEVHSIITTDMAAPYFVWCWIGYTSRLEMVVRAPGSILKCFKDTPVGDVLPALVGTLVDRADAAEMLLVNIINEFTARFVTCAISTLRPLFNGSPSSIPHMQVVAQKGFIPFEVFPPHEVETVGGAAWMRGIHIPVSPRMAAPRALLVVHNISQLAENLALGQYVLLTGNVTGVTGILSLRGVTERAWNPRNIEQTAFTCFAPNSGELASIKRITMGVVTTNVHPFLRKFAYVIENLANRGEFGIVRASQRDSAKLTLANLAVHAAALFMVHLNLKDIPDTNEEGDLVPRPGIPDALSSEWAVFTSFHNEADPASYTDLDLIAFLCTVPAEYDPNNKASAPSWKFGINPSNGLRGLTVTKLPKIFGFKRLDSSTVGSAVQVTEKLLKGAPPAGHREMQIFVQPAQPNTDVIVRTAVDSPTYEL
jgi:hypothetical protein